MNPPLPKRSWTIYEETRNGPNQLCSARGLACFFAADESLAQVYADLFYPPINGRVLCIEPADAVAYGLGNQARSRFLLDVDIAIQQRDFVQELNRDGVGVCWVCGCTENNACEGGCWWVLPNKLCSACCQRAGISPEQRSAYELAQRNDMTPDALPPEIHFPPDPAAGVELRKGLFSLFAGDYGTAFEHLMRTCRIMAPHVAPELGMRFMITEQPYYPPDPPAAADPEGEGHAK